jgi:hypothetical protein
VGLAVAVAPSPVVVVDCQAALGQPTKEIWVVLPLIWIMAPVVEVPVLSELMEAGIKTEEWESHLL